MTEDAELAILEYKLLLAMMICNNCKDPFCTDHRLPEVKDD